MTAEKDKEGCNSNPSGLSGFSSSAFQPGSQLSSDDDLQTKSTQAAKTAAKKGSGVKSTGSITKPTGPQVRFDWIVSLLSNNKEVVSLRVNFSHAARYCLS
ncbi:hypothetical protein BIW11_00418 [Tropilaelaps mercedesae]|uniref:Uncharacterized protein n=1 Tax=Tropilaelaps mercedesae TaxID=418985 RepID=A0A1V9XW53_9ACAR|nr:hypothetical protein BIW11_00418 [Tropilaelaps mercedesae]